jgi:crotonobetainyl-CoA:carnitine CoA-transferase CaiB-like acyl-CoA transferase
MEHPKGGAIPTVALPIKFSESTVKYELPPPMLGEHTDEILAEIGGEEG